MAVEAQVTHRSDLRLFLVEDFSLIRAGIEKVLKGAGYGNFHSYVNGEDCYQEILRIKQEVEASEERIRSRLNLLAIDIEMPKMDGLTLCKMVKEDPFLKDVIVVLFSSLING